MNTYDVTDFIKHKEFNYCHKCGMYLILDKDMSIGLCNKCIDADDMYGEIKAKCNHHIVHEVRERICGLRKKYFPDTSLWIQIRKKGIANDL